MSTPALLAQSDPGLLSVLHGLLPSPNWLAAHVDVLAGSAVAAATAILLVVRWRQAEKAYLEELELTEEEIAQRRLRSDTRGRRREDIWTVLVASAAAGLSSTGLRKMGRDLIGLPSPWDWMPFVALDVAAYVCGMRARRRSRNGQSPGISGALVWVFALISSAFSASEGAHLRESIARAPWPIIAAVLFELGSLEERTAARELARRAGDWLDRRIRLVRMLHPVEWVKVALALAADENMSQADATRRVRIQTAADRLYRVRQLDGQNEDGKKPGWFSARWRERAVRRAQAAQARLSLPDQVYVLAGLERLVRTPETATVDFAKRKEVEAAQRSFLTVTDPAGTADLVPTLYPGTGLYSGTQDRTQPGVPGTPADTASESSPVLASHPGTATTGTGTSDPYPGTGQPGTALYPGTATAGTGTPARTWAPGDPYSGTGGTGTTDQADAHPGTATAATSTGPDAVPGENPQVSPSTSAPEAGTHDGAGTHAGTAHRGPFEPDSVYEYGNNTSGTSTGTDTDATPHGAGTDTGPHEEPAGTGGSALDDEAMAAKLLPYFDEDGALSLGIRDVKNMFRVGQPRAQRVIDLAAAKLRTPAAGRDAQSEDQAATTIPSSGPDVAAAQPMPAERREFADAAA
ncbi:hypothetical protein ACFWXO_13815 [Kitasatospora sp. NPDC059088]|uniref:hypothetical protein n=1 Tax=Kitasatospora sp. NPDC059088 TaxID=3346722 RepID=UPI0036B20C91